MSQLLQSKLEFYLDDVPYVLDNLRHSKDESAMEIYKLVRKSPDRIVSVPKGLDLIKQQGFALSTDASYAYPKLKGTPKQMGKRAINHHSCRYHTSTCTFILENIRPCFI